MNELAHDQHWLVPVQLDSTETEKEWLVIAVGETRFVMTWVTRSEKLLIRVQYRQLAPLVLRLGARRSEPL